MNQAAVIRKLAERFGRANKQCYLVGGSVRDWLLGRPSPDLDFTTDAHPDQIQAIVRPLRPDALFTVGEKFGTIGMLFGEHHVEITTFRSEKYQPRSRHPAVEFGGSLEGDLARRDFTINALAIDARVAGATDPERRPQADQIVDPFGGLVDLDRRIIRAVGRPAERFDEDPLRLLRAIRFAAQLAFRIDPETQSAIQAVASSLADVSLERIAAEFGKLLVAPHPAHGIRLTVDLGLMPYIVPELLEMLDMPSAAGRRGYKEVYGHTLMVVERIPADPLLRWAALLHDIAKPRTITWEHGDVHFRAHERVGETMTLAILKRLRFDKEFVERVGRLVRLHVRANSFEPDWTDSALRRFLREIEDDLPALIALSRADVTSARPAKVEAAQERARQLEAAAADLLAREDVAKLASPLDGNELMAMFNRPPGRWIGAIKDYLLDLVLEGELTPDDKETARELARAFDMGRGSSGPVTGGTDRSLADS